jgi:anti-anti-sigma regulatory factor
MTGAGLSVEEHDLAGACVLEPRGLLDVPACGALRESLVRTGADEPSAVIVDLGGLEIPDDAALSLFRSAGDQLAQWPGVPLLLVAGRAEHRRMLDRYEVCTELPVHPSVPAAAAALGRPPPRRVARLTLPNSMTGARLARAFVERTCVRWERTGDALDAVTVVNELVENTLLHTYSAPSVRLELRRGLLTVAVYDDDPAPPRMGGPTPAIADRRGLLLVDRLVAVWGCSPTRSGGKAVWAVL